MANRRMFSRDVVETDKFLGMPLTSQALYFHLGMEADDDGFVPSPRKVQRAVGCSEGDLKQLALCGYIIPFESGVIVIAHWKQSNYVQADRYKKTLYQDEASKLILEKSVYKLDTACIQVDSKMDTQDRLSKDRLGKDRLGEVNIYIGDDKQPVSKMDTEQTTHKKKVATSAYVVDPELNTAICDFIEHRKKMRKPMTDKAIELFVQRLQGMADNVPDQISLINTAIERGWMTVYPPKDEQRQTSAGQSDMSVNDYLLGVINGQIKTEGDDFF